MRRDLVIMERGIKLGEKGAKQPEITTHKNSMSLKL